MRKSSAQCRVFGCKDNAYTIKGLCPTHTNMASIIRAARVGAIPYDAQKYFLSALENGYGVA